MNIPGAVEGGRGSGREGGGGTGAAGTDETVVDRGGRSAVLIFLSRSRASSCSILW